MESAEVIYQYAWLVPVLPLIGAALVGTGLISYNDATSKLRRHPSIFIVSLTGATMVLSFLLIWSQIQGHEPFAQMIEWASAGDFRLEMGYTIDHLAALMLVIVTTVAFLVMVYTHGYMAHDPGYVRFYAYLSLFSSSMLGLVISPNLLQVYVFWELVGMCSYLLIGFWYERKGAADACQKAFVTNRVGDFGLLLGMLAIFWATGSFDFDVMGERLTDLVNTGSLERLAMVSMFAVWCFLGPWRSRLSSPCMSGCPTPWKARLPFRLSSTPPPWWLLGSSWWLACIRSSRTFL
jgi:NAD(P)H-quinone oxidoreductase subunit 5